jgi:BirA family biotin operon repressor/biotin-[acetyl-CoA-carboxylase] ligase
VYTDLNRPPLSAAALTRAVRRDLGPWREVRVVTSTGSTNADLLAGAGQGGPDAAEGLVLVADEQTAGRGRAGRGWWSPARAGLAVSVLLRPGAGPGPVPTSSWSWLPLLAGVALCRVVTLIGGVPARLKWPNDLLLGEAKVAGTLAEVGDGGAAVVLGIGLNVTTTAAELPPPEPAALPGTSLALAGAGCTDRGTLLRGLLRELGQDYLTWRLADGDAGRSGLRQAYLESCGTIGRTVRVSMPGARELLGDAVDIDGDGRLVIAAVDGSRRCVAAGDVSHLRPIVDVSRQSAAGPEPIR